MSDKPEIITNKQIYDNLATVLGVCLFAKEFPEDMHPVVCALRGIDLRCVVTALDRAREGMKE